MSSDALAQELRRLADEARTARERLGEIGRQIQEMTAELAALPAPEPIEPVDDGPRLQSVP
jgi:hypothetical protein